MSLKNVRKSKDLTLDDLARISSVPRSSISGYENGTQGIKPEYLRKLALALGVDASDLNPSQDIPPFEAENGSDWKARAVAAETQLEAVRNLLKVKLVEVAQSPSTEPGVGAFKARVRAKLAVIKQEVAELEKMVAPAAITLVKEPPEAPESPAPTKA